MKVIIKKKYYEEDLYCIPGIPGHGGGLTKGKLMDYVEHVRDSAKIEYRKGDFDRWEVKTGKYCCDDLAEHGRPQVEWYWKKDSNKGRGMFLPFQGYDEADYIKVDYCPFCGERIEVIEEE